MPRTKPTPWRPATDAERQASARDRRAAKMQAWERALVRIAYGHTATQAASRRVAEQALRPWQK